jgi:hypothetical protein
MARYGEDYRQYPNPFGSREQPRYYGTGSYGEGGAGFGGGYGRRERGDDIDDESRRDYRADYTSRRAYGENPYGYYGQYRSQGDYRDRYYSGGYDDGRVSTWRPDLRRTFRRGPKGYQRSDERIREDISDRLMQSVYIDSSEVTVSVANGVVTLDGTVPERRMKHAIEDLAESAAGVENIDNRIRVVRSDTE